MLASASSARAASDIWISRADVASLPHAGAAWENVFGEAQLTAATPNLSYGGDPTNVRILAKALMFVATGQTSYRGQVKTALTSIVNSGTYSGRALALARELAAYIISADLIDLRTNDPNLDRQFRSKIRELLTTPTIDGPPNLVICHERRPNNWGTHCGATRIAIARYLDDDKELAAAAAVFKGWLGDRSSYSSFNYGGLSWQSDPTRPLGINPRGARIQGHDCDGVLPDDQRREGLFRWPPPKVEYVYEALQGAVVEAELLSRAGYDAWQWQDQALRRAFEWLNKPYFGDTGDVPFTATGDDEWQPHLVNFVYGTGFETAVPANPGKNMGWTDWTHGTRAGNCPATGASLRLNRNLSHADRDVLVAQIVVSTPAGDFLNLVPTKDGVLVKVVSVMNKTRVNASVPGGSFDGKAGWKLNSSESRWTYVDKPDPARNGGINVVHLGTGHPTTSVRTTIKVKGKGSYPVVASDAPVTITVVPTGSQTRCAAYRFAFTASECTSDAQGTLSCRGRRAVR